MTDTNPGRTDGQDTASASTARAVCLTRFGGVDVLAIEQVPIPQPVDDEVLVRVHAASVNPVDLKTREGKFPPVGEDKLPIILGRDLAGTIAALGTRAHNMLSAGDKVFAHIGFDRGAQSDYVVVKAVELVAMPDRLDFAKAAAVPLVAMTAWQGLFDHGRLQEGQRVLIHGGAGGVGHMAVQLAKAKGATVLATAGADDLDFVRSLGADTAIDYRAERFEDVATDMDMVFDLIGGETQDRSFAVLKWGGALVSTLTEPDGDKAAAQGVRAMRYMAEPNAAQLVEIAGLIDDGKVRVVVDRTFPLAEVAAAHERQDTGHFRGKLVLTLD